MCKIRRSLDKSEVRLLSFSPHMTAMVWMLLLHFSIIQIVRSSCPSGFDLVSNGECRGSYINISLISDKAPQAAIDKCAEILGQPIIIHNEEEQSYWTSRTPTHSPKHLYSPLLLLGIVCNSSSKRYQWADGSAIDFKPPEIDNAEALDGDCTSSTINWWILSDGMWGFFFGGQFVVDISCTVPLHQPIPSPDGCDSFEDDSDDGICYQIGTAAENWQDAQLICSKLGANLASIHNLQENSFIRRLAVSKGAVNGVFLGATLSGKGKDFGWIDGSAWDYDHFYPGFPLPGIGNCLAMDTTKPEGQWMNIDCSAKLPVACVRAPKNVTEPTCNAGFSEEGKLINSPGFPYSASMPCDYFLDVEEGKSVEVEIVFLEANPCCDYLVIHDGYLGGSMIANLTGEIRNATYTSTSNLMRVSWQPNGGENVRGMAITYRGV